MRPKEGQRVRFVRPADWKGAGLSREERQPTISVVVPSHNSCATILRSLQSVYAQTVPAHEIVVVDDGSSDGTAEQVMEKHPDARVLHQPQSGPGPARNNGALHARGEWVAFLDADDVWLPDHLERLSDATRAFPDVLLVGSRAPKRSTAGRCAPRLRRLGRRSPVRRDYFVLAKRFRLHGAVDVSSIAVLRTVFTERGLRFPSEWRSEDMAFFCSVGALGFMGWVPEPTVIVSRTPGSLTSRVKIAAGEADCAHALRAPHYRVMTQLLEDASLGSARRSAIRRFRDDLIARHWLNIIAAGHQHCAREVLLTMRGTRTLQVLLLRVAARTPRWLSRSFGPTIQALMQLVGLPSTSPFVPRVFH